MLFVNRTKLKKSIRFKSKKYFNETVLLLGVGPGTSYLIVNGFVIADQCCAVTPVSEAHTTWAGLAQVSAYPKPNLTQPTQGSDGSHTIWDLAQGNAKPKPNLAFLVKVLVKHVRFGT